MAPSPADGTEGLPAAMREILSNIGMVDGGNFAKVIVRVGMLPDDV